MYGNKTTKRDRLAREVGVIDNEGPISRMDLARAVGVSRGQVEDDLADLEANGIMLHENDAGLLSRAFSWLWRR